MVQAVNAQTVMQANTTTSRADNAQTVVQARPALRANNAQTVEQALPALRANNAQTVMQANTTTSRDQVAAKIVIQASQAMRAQLV
jgi:anti-anti-sigma regulatory factor